MIRKSVIQGFLVVLSLLAFLPANVASASVVDAYQCEECASVAEMQGAAIQKAAAHFQIGPMYIYSLSNQAIGKFWVERWCEGGDPLGGPASHGSSGDGGDIQGPPCVWEYNAILTAVETEVEAFFDDMITAYQAYGNSLIGDEIVHYSEVAGHLSGNVVVQSLTGGSEFLSNESEPNAYHFVNNASFRGAILSVYNGILSERNNPHTFIRLMSAVGVTIGAANVDFKLQNAVQLRTLFVFSDGSEVSIRIENDHAQYRLGSAIDANDNPIPDPSYDPITGISPNETYLTGNHDPSDVSTWCDSLRMHMGISCSGSGGSVVACSRVGDGPMFCEIIQL